MTRLEILKTQLNKNKGHNQRAHQAMGLNHSGFTKSCYRCLIERDLAKEEQQQKYLTALNKIAILGMGELAYTAEFTERVNMIVREVLSG